MSRREQTLSFEEITEDDVPELTGVMTRAFDDDASEAPEAGAGWPRGVR